MLDGAWLESKVPTYFHILTIQVLNLLQPLLLLCVLTVFEILQWSHSFLSFNSRSWKFQPQTLLETLLRDQPYSWSLSSTKMTTVPFSKRRITQEKCLRDPLQVGDIEALKGPGVLELLLDLARWQYHAHCHCLSDCSAHRVSVCFVFFLLDSLHLCSCTDSHVSTCWLLRLHLKPRPSAGLHPNESTN